MRANAEHASHRLDIEGNAGDVRYVRLVGSMSAWSTSYRWEIGADEDVRRQAPKSKLIADLRLP